MRKQWLLTALMIGSVACSKQVTTADFNIVPMPQRIEALAEEGFVIRNSTRIVYPEGNKVLKRNAELLAEYIADIAELKLNVTSRETDSTSRTRIPKPTNSPSANRR